MYKKDQIIDSTYQIIDKLGKGSHGEVFTACPVSNPKDIIAIKIIDISDTSHSSIDSNSDKDSDNNKTSIIEMVKSEFNLLKSLNHENIVKVYDVGFDSKIGKLYYTMEFLEGKILYDFFKDDFNEDNFLDVVHQTLLGLSFLHDHNIIHYDIKPENIFVCKYEDNKNIKENDEKQKGYKSNFVLKLFDFGLSEIKQKESKELKNIKGTIEYMAPEVLLTPDRVTFNSDLYSLAVSLTRSILQFNTDILNSTKTEFENDFFSVQSYISDLHNENLEILNKIKNPKIIEFLTILLNENPNYRIQNSRSAIEKLNFIFNKKYLLVSACKQKSFLNNDFFIVRERKIKELLSLYDEFCMSDRTKSNLNIIFISGLKGSGKSKIIDNFYFTLSIKLNRVIKKDFNKFNNKKSLNNELNNLKEELKAFEENKEFKNNSFNKRTYIFHNFENYCNSVKDQIFSLLEIYKGSTKIFFVLISNNETEEKAYYLKYKYSNFNAFTKEIKLNPLKSKDVTNIVNYFIGETQNFPHKFSDDLVLYSDGNFKKIMFFLDKFRSEKVIERVSNIVIFKDKKKYDKILKSEYRNKIKYVFENLKQLELMLVKTIYINFYPLTKNQLIFLLQSQMVQSNEIKNAILNLVKKKIIHLKKSRNKNTYFIESNDVFDFMKKKITKKEIKSLFQKIYLDNFEDQRNKNIINISKILFFKQKATIKNISELSRNIRKLYKKKSIALNFDRYIEVFILNLYRFTPDNEFKFKLRLELIKYYNITRKHLDEYKFLKLNGNNILKNKIKVKTNLTEYIILKLRSFHPIKNNFDLKQFYLDNIEFLYKNYPRKKFYNEQIKLAAILKDIKKSVTFSLNDLIEFLLLKLNNEKNNDLDLSIYKKILLIYQVDLEADEISEKRFEIFKSELNYFISNNIFDDNYFRYFNSFVEIAAKLNINIESEILFSQNIAIKEKMYVNLLDLLDSISSYYYSTSSYKKSLIFNQRIIDLSKKLKIPIKIHTYLDLMVSKYMLAEPISEIVNLFKSIDINDDLIEDTSAYLDFLYNRIFMTHQIGDFSSSRKLYREYLLNSNKLNLNEIEKYLFNEDDLIILPELFTKDEFLEIIDKLYKEKTIKKRDHFKIIEKANMLFKIRIRHDFNPQYCKKVLNEPLSHMTPFMIVEFIKEKKALPSAKEIITNTSSSYRNSSNISNYTCFLITQFFFLKNEELLDEIYNNLHKFYNNGYYLKVIYFLLPIIDFMLITKMNLITDNKKFLILLDEIFKGIIQKMDGNLLSIFKQTYIYKRKRKLDKKF